MAPLQNPAIERPLALFEVDLVIFGTLYSSATRLSISVLAETSRGARRICMAQYRRAEVKHTRKVGVILDMCMPRCHRDLSQAAL